MIAAAGSDLEQDVSSPEKITYNGKRNVDQFKCLFESVLKNATIVIIKYPNDLIRGCINYYVNKSLHANLTSIMILLISLQLMTTIEIINFCLK